MKGCAPGLVLKQRQKATLNWPIDLNLVPRAISTFKMADGREEDPGEQQIT